MHRSYGFRFFHPHVYRGGMTASAIGLPRAVARSCRLLLLRPWQRLCGRCGPRVDRQFPARSSSPSSSACPRRRALATLGTNFPRAYSREGHIGQNSRGTSSWEKCASSPAGPPTCLWPPVRWEPSLRPSSHEAILLPMGGVLVGRVPATSNWPTTAVRVRRAAGFCAKFACAKPAIGCVSDLQREPGFSLLEMPPRS